MKPSIWLSEHVLMCDVHRQVHFCPSLQTEPRCPLQETETGELVCTVSGKLVALEFTQPYSQPPEKILCRNVEDQVEPTDEFLYNLLTQPTCEENFWEVDRSLFRDHLNFAETNVRYIFYFMCCRLWKEGKERGAQDFTKFHKRCKCNIATAFYNSLWTFQNPTEPKEKEGYRKRYNLERYFLILLKACTGLVQGHSLYKKIQAKKQRTELESELNFYISRCQDLSPYVVK